MVLAKRRYQFPTLAFRCTLRCQLGRILVWKSPKRVFYPFQEFLRSFVSRIRIQNPCNTFSENGGWFIIKHLQRESEIFLCWCISCVNPREKMSMGLVGRAAVGRNCMVRAVSMGQDGIAKVIRGTCRWSSTYFLDVFGIFTYVALLCHAPIEHPIFKGYLK